MAIDFNALTSKLENTTYNAVSGAFTLCFWSYADGVGEANEGRIITLPEGGSSFVRHRNGTADQMELVWDFTGGGSVDGQWRWTAADNQWNAIGISYDPSATTNDPAVLVNGVNVTVTEVSTPVGTGGAGTGGYCVGGNTAQTRTWDGGIQCLQTFAGLDTSGTRRIGALLRPGSIRPLTLFLPMLDATWTRDYSGNGGHGTGTDLATRATSPRHAAIWPGRAGWQGNTPAPTPTTGGSHVLHSSIFHSGVFGGGRVAA